MPEGTAEKEEITGVFEMRFRQGITFEFKLAAFVFCGVGELQDEGELALKGFFAELAAVLMPVVELAVCAVVFGELPLGAAVLEIVAKGGIGAEDLALDTAKEPEEIQIIVAQPADGGAAEFFIDPALTAMADDGWLGGVVFYGMLDEHGAFFRGQKGWAVIPVIASHEARRADAQKAAFWFCWFAVNSGNRLAAWPLAMPDKVTVPVILRGEMICTLS